MKTLKIEIPGKPNLYVPVYDLTAVLLWLVQYLPEDNINVKITTVEL